MGLRLIIEDYEGSTTVFPLGEAPITIGREESNTICLTEKNVSRLHARLVPADTGWAVEDLESYNGVRVNGGVVDNAHVIHEGDLIQIGDYQLLLGDDTSTRSTIDLGPNVIAAANGVGGAAAAAALPIAAAKEAREAGARVVEEPAVVTPAAADSGDYDEIAAPGSGGGKGLMIVVLLGALGVGAWWFTKGTQDSSAQNGTPGAVAANDSPKETQTPALAEAATDESEDDSETVMDGQAGDGDETAGETAAQGGETADENADEGATEAGPDDSGAGAIADDEGGDDAAAGEDPPTPEPAVPTPVAKKKKKKKKSTSTTPTPAPAGASADDLLKDARKAQLGGNYSQAYSLAKKSYAAAASADAAQVMGVAACKMGDAAKAKSAYGKLSGSKKSALQAVCAKSGIEL